MNAVHETRHASRDEDTVLVADRLAKHYTVRRGMFGVGTVKALNGVSFTLKRGKTLAVVGESGCGKSTLARQLTMIETPTSGHLTIDGKDVAGADRATIADLRRRVQMVFQNPFASLNPRKTVEQTLAEPLEINANLSAAERATRIAQIMRTVGLRPEHAKRYPHMFSGGQRQRVAIARVMLKDAPILVLDEATSALDSEVEVAIQRSLDSLMNGKTVIAIAHRLSTIAAMDRLIVLDEGRIVEEGTHQQLLQAGGIYAALWAHQSGGFLGETVDAQSAAQPAEPVARATAS